MRRVSDHPAKMRVEEVLHVEEHEEHGKAVDGEREHQTARVASGIFAMSTGGFAIRFARNCSLRGSA